MTHDSFRNIPDISLTRMDASVRRAHQMRSRSIGRFFRKSLDRCHRALHVLDGRH